MNLTDVCKEDFEAWLVQHEQYKLAFVKENENGQYEYLIYDFPNSCVFAVMQDYFDVCGIHIDVDFQDKTTVIIWMFRQIFPRKQRSYKSREEAHKRAIYTADKERNKQLKKGYGLPPFYKK